jgi:WD40 repeat protein
LPGGGVDSTTLLWSADNWTYKELRGGRKPIDRAGPVAFSKDSQLVATTGVHQNILLWDTASAKPWADMRGHARWISSIEFSPTDSRVLASTGGLTTFVWNIGEEADNGKAVLTLHGHDGEVLDAAFSPNGDEIITASEDGTARVWALNLGTELSGRGQPRCRREPTVSSFDKKITLTLHDDEVLRHDNHENSYLPPLRGHGATVESVAFSSDGTQIVTAGGVDNTARIWGARTGNVLKILAGHEAGVFYAEFDKTGNLVVTAKR